MIRINLLPVRISKKKVAGKQQVILLAAIVVAGYVGNLIWASARASDLETRQTKIKKMKQEISQLDRIIGEVKNIKEQQAALREKLRILEELKANRSGPVRVLDALATVTPKRLWLTKMEEKAGTITFTGAASTIDDVSEFMSALKANTHFTKIELLKTTAAMTANKALEYVEFTLTAGVTYAPKPPAPAPTPGAPAGKAR